MKKPTLREVRKELRSKASLLEKFYSCGADDYFAEILRRALELLPKKEPGSPKILVYAKLGGKFEKVMTIPRLKKGKTK